MKNKLVRINGTVFIHSIPYAAIQYIERIINETLKQGITLNWSEQQASAKPNMMKTTFNYIAYDGTAAKLASNLRGWEHLRYAITQNPGPDGIEGGRWMHTPSLGIFYQIIDSVGNALIPEQRIKTVIETGGNLAQVREKLDLALGTAWDIELEPFRMSDSNIKWMF